MIVVITAASVGAVSLGTGMKLWPRLVAAAIGLVAAVWIGLSGLTGPPDNIWQYFQPTHMKEALDKGRPVVLDFHADWCAPCRELGRTMAKPEVVELLKQTARVQSRPDRLEVNLGRKAAPEIRGQGSYRRWSSSCPPAGRLTGFG